MADEKKDMIEDADAVVPTPTPAEEMAPVKPAKASKATAPEEEMVSLPATEFAAVMARLASLEEKQGLLMQVQDKDKIQKIEDLRRSGKLVKSVKVRKYNGKYIIGWKTVQDEVYKDENGRLIEKQTLKIFFEDDTEQEMTMRQWASAPEYVAFEVKKESKNEDGDLFFTVLGPTGKELELNAVFIN